LGGYIYHNRMQTLGPTARNNRYDKRREDWLQDVGSISKYCEWWWSKRGTFIAVQDCGRVFRVYMTADKQVNSLDADVSLESTLIVDQTYHNH
jgi:hypothetical protein